MSAGGRVRVLVLVGMVVSGLAVASDELDGILDFEGSTGGALQGWSGAPAETLGVDGEVVHGGKLAGRILRDGDSGGQFSAMNVSLPVDFEGKEITLTGWLRTADVEGYAGIWLREDGNVGAVAFDNMQSRQLKGTTEWTEYRITLPLKSEARTLFLGALLAGSGTVWVDDLDLLVDGKPLSEAPRIEMEPTSLDLDHEFDDGSRVDVEELTVQQIDNLTLLGRIWGFIKYHHPKVAAGELHWDYEMFRVLPRMLEAKDDQAAREVLLRWLDGIGRAAACEPCAKLPAENLYFGPGLDWIGDEKLLGTELSTYLKLVYENRFAGDEQLWVTLSPGVGNPVFASEPNYDQFDTPDAGYRILALYRFWSIVRYFFPYRDVIDGDWNAVLSEYLPRLVVARDCDAYRLAMMALSARVGDGHAKMWREMDVLPPRGDCWCAARFRFLEGRPVVTAYTDDTPRSEKRLMIGDALLAIGGRDVSALMKEWAPYYAASNEWSVANGMMRFISRGDCGEVALRVQRQGKPVELTETRVKPDGMDPRRGRMHDRPGETFQRLSGEIAYLKLSSVSGADAAKYVEEAKGAKALVVDIRNYPAEFVVFQLGQHLVSEPAPFARFTVGDPSNPGAFVFTDPALEIEPGKPHFAGKLVILVDESSKSQAEYTAMAFRAAPEAIVVGSPTAGADGNVSAIPLPGNLTSMISGIGVFYPDKTPTQRVGIVPDVLVHPTIASIIEGRDLVLEEAIRQILGPDADESEIRRLAAPPPESSVEKQPE